VILRDITERKQAEQALVEADQRKSEFLVLLAHELRNPMAVTATAAYVLQSKGLTDPEVCRWATTTITNQTELLKRLVDDLLDVEREPWPDCLEKIPLGSGAAHCQGGERTGTAY
jgi:signal transduction histidine kinase